MRSEQKRRWDENRYICFRLCRSSYNNGEKRKEEDVQGRLN